MPTALPRRTLLKIAPLPPPCRPARAIRVEEVTLLWCDPSATVLECVGWMLDNMTVEENNLLRAAYGVGPLGERIPDSLVAGIMADYAIAPCLRLRSDVPQQQTG